MNPSVFIEVYPSLNQIYLFLSSGNLKFCLIFLNLYIIIHMNPFLSFLNYPRISFSAYLFESLSYPWEFFSYNHSYPFESLYFYTSLSTTYPSISFPIRHLSTSILFYLPTIHIDPFLSLQSVHLTEIEHLYPFPSLYYQQGKFGLEEMGDLFRGAEFVNEVRESFVDRSQFSDLKSFRP